MKLLKLQYKDVTIRQILENFKRDKAGFIESFSSPPDNYYYIISVKLHFLVQGAGDDLTEDQLATYLKLIENDI